VKKKLEKYKIRRPFGCVTRVILKNLKLLIQTNIILKFGPYIKEKKKIMSDEINRSEFEGDSEQSPEWNNQT
jgi:hypothetical protein